MNDRSDASTPDNSGDRDSGMNRSQAPGAPAQGKNLAELIMLVVCMMFPTVVGVLSFVVLNAPPTEVEGATAVAAESTANPAQQIGIGLAKVAQFLLPLIFVLIWDRSSLRPVLPGGRGMMLGLGFGLLVVAATFALYFPLLKPQGLFADTPAKIMVWLRRMNMATFGRYVGLAVGISVLHSFLEEYYFRWFIFARLRHWMSVNFAIVVSALAFMAHHVVVLWYYFPGKFWLAALPLSVCVGVGGAVWAWIYQRSGSLYAIWLSHCLVDLGIMFVGYDLLANQLPS